MDSKRVRYFSQNDFLYGKNLSKIETITIPSFDTMDINDAIEFFQIKKFFDDGVFYKEWTDKQKEEYKSKSKVLYGLTLRYMNSISDNNIIEIFQTIEREGTSAFFELFDICKLYKKISPVVFSKIIECNNFAPFDLFTYKDIVCSYGNELRNYILNNEFAVSILINVYNQPYTNSPQLYLPKELTKQDIYDFLVKYISSENASYHFLQDISQMKSERIFAIDDELRYAAKKKCVEYLEKHKNNTINYFYTYAVVIADEWSDELPVKFTFENNEVVFSYSKNWLLETLDYPSILNNFIHIFNFADIQMRWTMTFHKSKSGITETIFSNNTSLQYPKNTFFGIYNTLSHLTIASYYSFLKSNNIRYEDVLKWCFTEYLQKEFNCPEIRLQFPSETTTYYEKCHLICGTIEFLLKQFNSYVKHNEINFEFLKMATSSVKFGDVLSLVDNKYIYGSGKDFNNLVSLMFSDQNYLLYIKRIKHEYSSFLELIVNESVYLSDYKENDLPSIHYLEKFGLIKITDDERIVPGDKLKLSILRDLYDNDVISKTHYSSSFNTVFSEWIESGILIQNSSLFSKPEVDYLDYLLNNAQFTNGLGLRNKYSHGIEQIVEDEDTHRSNYFIFLKILTLIAIKINDEFCIIDDLKRDENA